MITAEMYKIASWAKIVVLDINRRASDWKC